MTRDRIVRVLGASDGRATPHDGRYVASWNPHPHTPAGTLALTSTSDLAAARRFSLKELLAERRTVSRVEPSRPWDGKPNRPLAGLTVAITAVQSDD